MQNLWIDTRDLNDFAQLKKKVLFWWSKAKILKIMEKLLRTKREKEPNSVFICKINEDSIRHGYVWSLKSQSFLNKGGILYTNYIWFFFIYYIKPSVCWWKVCSDPRNFCLSSKALEIIPFFYKIYGVGFGYNC